MSYETEIEILRKKINIVDRKIIQLLNKRFDVVSKIKKLKRKYKKPILAKNREKVVFERVKKFSHKLYSRFFIEIYKKILSQSKKYQL